MDDCDKFNEASLPGKEDYYNNLNMEDITLRLLAQRKSL